jgi:hypothetical protein
MTSSAWDTGCSDWLHGKQMKHRESDPHKCRMDFEGFGDDMEAVSKVEAGVAYAQFTVPSSHRLDSLRGANLAAGWTSRNEGYSTLICGPKGQSCIHRAKSMKRYELVDKEEQPVVGKLINEGDSITREIGWMAFRHKGKLTQFESSQGRVIDLDSRSKRMRVATASSLKQADVCVIKDQVIPSRKDDDQILCEAPQDQSILRETAPQSTQQALGMAKHDYPDLMERFMDQRFMGRSYGIKWAVQFKMIIGAAKESL